MTDNQQTDEMREAFEEWYEVRNAKDISTRYTECYLAYKAAATRYEAALRDVSELIGLAKNTGSESYLEKALATIDKLLGGK